MSRKTFFGTPGKFCGMCGVVGIKDSPIIITYYFLFVNKREIKYQQEKKESERITMAETAIWCYIGWVPVHRHCLFITLAIYSISIYNTISSAYLPKLIYFSVHLPLLSKNIWFYSTFYITNRFISSN